MIVDLPSTTTSAVNHALIDIRQRGGAVALGRVLTLVIITDDSVQVEQSIEAANEASKEHPCRVLVVARGLKRAGTRLDAQIRVGGDAGASDVLVLRLYGPLADHGDSVVVPLLLPDCPVVAWWPGLAPPIPAQDPIGRLAQRRITDAAAAPQPIKALESRRAAYADGDTDLAWSRLTPWRALLAAALDLPPHEDVEAVTVTGAADNPSADLLAGWLRSRLQVPVRRRTSPPGGGISSAVLERRCGPVELVRPDGKVGTLRQRGQPDRRMPLRRRPVRECLTEELRRLDPDEIYHAALQAVTEVNGRRGGAAKGVRSGESRGSP
ncbi:MAG: glucose-6-phosphate dehydrogenase assembly protein OpcA [Pseudonocardiales bacterium]|nr:glucose-6-phosphate dehydrogenase assembly protein OpcA [Pseudonocardiales bacterium]MBV9030750.1 glucose-6-phosphate dehydrogenase assembly protein OpcA [Pseudonocardiales bacterium]